MNNIKHIAILVSLLTTGIFSNHALAQRGMLDNALGLRFGLGSGVTYQHFFTDHKALEVIAMQRFGGASLTGLYQIHTQAFDVRGLKWYIGGGGHVGGYGKRSVLHDGSLRDNIFVAGVDGILGLEYFLVGLPLQISADWKPAINLVGTSYYEWDSGAISIRYRF